MAEEKVSTTATTEPQQVAETVIDNKSTQSKLQNGLKNGVFNQPHNSDQKVKKKPKLFANKKIQFIRANIKPNFPPNCPQVISEEGVLKGKKIHYSK